MQGLRIALTLAALAVPAVGGRAQGIDPLQARSWAGACAACHGTDGNAQPGSIALAGMNRDELARKMLDFKNGRQGATVMHQLAKGYSDEQIAAIAGYFAAQKK